MNRLRALALALVASLALACSVTAPAPEPPSATIELPPGFSTEPATEYTSAARSDRDPWWRPFSDPALDRLIVEALEHNRDLQAAAARVDAALARARIVGAPLAPQLSASLRNQRSKQNFVGFPIPGREGSVLSTTSSNATLGLSASWEPDLWARLRHDRASSLAEADATVADLDAARLSLSGQVARIYFLLTEAAEQVRLTERTLTSRRSTEQRVRARYERGLVPSLELRLASTQVHTVEAALALRRQAVETQRRQLEVLLGRYPAGELEGAEALATAPPPIPGGVPAEVLRRRPDLRAAERRTQAAARAVGAARAARLPRLTLTGSAGTLSSDVEDLLDRTFSVWSLASSLLQPIFQGGRLRAGVAVADATLEQAAAAWAQSALTAFAEVETALTAEQHLRARLQALAGAVDASSAAARLAEDRYRRGLADYLSVLESQRQTFAAESELLATRRELLTRRVDLLLALGGSVEPSGSRSSSSTPAEQRTADTRRAEPAGEEPR